jgi:enoyl-CoA hydratase/carnithine racemase
MSDALILQTEDGAIVQMILNRPQSGNSLSFEMIAQLRSALEAVAVRREIKVIILSGAGGRIFCAGHDLGEFAQEQLAPEKGAHDFSDLAALMQTVMAQPQIVIAKVEGVATAAGCELVAACDLALASSVARFAVPGVNIGFWCHSPQIQLSRMVGRKAAMMMLATGKLFPAAHALSIGLINEVHAPEALDAAVDALAAEIASKSGAILALGKRSFQHQAPLNLADAYQFAGEAANANLQHPDAQEGIAAFLQKRPPNWVG